MSLLRLFICSKPSCHFDEIANQLSNVFGLSSRAKFNKHLLGRIEDEIARGKSKRQIELISLYNDVATLVSARNIIKNHEYINIEFFSKEVNEALDKIGTFLDNNGESRQKCDEVCIYLSGLSQQHMRNERYKSKGIRRDDCVAMTALLCLLSSPIVISLATTISHSCV